METLQKGLKWQRHQNGVTYVALVSLLLTLNIFHTFSSVSNVDFEQENVYWVSFALSFSMIFAVKYKKNNRFQNKAAKSL